MLSFHNDPLVKAKYTARIKAHAKADEIIKGQYWQNGKGCAVGCVIHSTNHKAFEIELGIPEWLAKLEDVIFEALPNGDAKSFAVNFLDAIPVGVNLEHVKWRFCAFILKENIERVLALEIDNILKQQVVTAIGGVLALHEKAALDGDRNWSARSAWSAAESAAESAAWSAWSAAALSAAYKRYADELLRLLSEAK